MGIFQGISSLFNAPPRIDPGEQWLPFNNQLVGHVLDVILDDKHKWYDPEKDNIIGTIFFRDAFANYGGGITAFSEALGPEGKAANPLDRTNLHVPLPGEQVIIFRAKSSRLNGPDVFVSSKYYYTAVVNMTPNLTINSAPFIGIDPDLLNPFIPGARSVGELSKRFDKKINSLAAFKEGKKPFASKQLNLNEGDFILQGRFGGSIRFAGTPVSSQIEKNSQLWAEGDKGLPGDPIMIMRVDNGKANFNNLNDTLYDTEDIDEDGASLYMTSTQQIIFDLALPPKGDKAHPLASWAYSIGVTAVETDIVLEVNKVQDGEAAREGEDKTVAKEGGVDAEVSDSSTSETTEEGVVEGELPPIPETELPTEEIVSPPPSEPPTTTP